MVLYHPSKVDEKALAQAVARIPELKKQMRAGACSDIDKLMYKKLVLLAKGVFSKEETDVTLGLLESLISGLSMYKNTEGVLQLLQKLEQYQKKDLGHVSSKSLGINIGIDAPYSEKSFTELKNGDFPKQTVD